MKIRIAMFPPIPIPLSRGRFGSDHAERLAGDHKQDAGQSGGRNEELSQAEILTTKRTKDTREAASRRRRGGIRQTDLVSAEHGRLQAVPLLPRYEGSAGSRGSLSVAPLSGAPKGGRRVVL